MTLRMYANHKKWPLEAVRVTLQHERRHAEDCDDCEKTGKKIDVLTRRIEIEGELDEEQRKRMMQIADKCPVHKTLHGEIHVESELVS